MHEILQGIRNICAVITPFDETGSNIDFQSHERHLHFLKNNGVDAIVSLGTTGESPTVMFGEHEKMIEEVIRFSPLPVIAGAGGNTTDEAVHLTVQAEKAGAKAILSVCPYYNKPNQEGIFRHYAKIFESTSLPVILYNVPGRTVVSIEVSTTLRLRDRYENFAGIKEASANLVAVQRYVRECVPVYCGEDALNFVMLCLGAKGLISVLSNFAPRRITDLIRAVQKNQLEEARLINNEIADFSKAAFIDTNPIPVKFICSILGFCHNSLRLPLTPLSEENQQTVLDLIGKHMSFPAINK